MGMRDMPRAWAVVAGLWALGGVPATLVAAGEAETTAAPAGDFAERVDQTVRDRQPTAEERRFDEIGWLTEIRPALELAKKHDRPVFLFTHDGRMALGRC